jgi:hypothetical protein
LGSDEQMSEDKVVSYVYAIVNIRNGDILVITNVKHLDYVIRQMLSMGVSAEDFYIRIFEKVEILTDAESMSPVN